MNREERRKGVQIETGPGTGVRRVGRRLPGVHIGTPESRAGIPLEAQVAEVIRQVETQDPPIEGPQDLEGHVPQIGALELPSAWGVFCMRCSAEAGQYVHPCRVDPHDWPPNILYESVESISPGA